MNYRITEQALFVAPRCQRGDERLAVGKRTGTKYLYEVVEHQDVIDCMVNALEVYGQDPSREDAVMVSSVFMRLLERDIQQQLDGLVLSVTETLRWKK